MIFLFKARRNAERQTQAELLCSISQNQKKAALLTLHAHFFFVGGRGEDRPTSALSSSAFDQRDRSPLYCLTPNLLLIEKIVVLLQDIRSAISGADNSVDERR
jgi:hypothetical protein